MEIQKFLKIAWRIKNNSYIYNVIKGYENSIRKRSKLIFY